MRRLKSEPCTIIYAPIARALDLTRQAETENWIRDHRPDVVIVAAAQVGGIAYNNAFPVDFLADNLAIELNVIRGSHAAGVRKLVVPRLLLHLSAGWRRSRCARRCC